MGLTNELVGSKKPVKINAFMLTRAELLITLCYEIPCRSLHLGQSYVSDQRTFWCIIFVKKIMTILNPSINRTDCIELQGRATRKK